MADNTSPPAGTSTPGASTVEKSTAPIDKKAPPLVPGVDGATVDEGGVIVHISFWQQPWVQNILPFATSLVLHVGLIVLGYATFKTVEHVVRAVTQEQVIIPEATLAENGPPGGILNPGLGGDPNRRAEQNIDEAVTQDNGWAEKKGEALQASLAGGGAGESEGEAVIGIGGAATAFGKGKTSGSGSGDGFGMGTGGDGTGVLAPFGTPGGGGGIGPKSAFVGVGGNARKISYLCDASGSMGPVFSALRDELKRSVSGLVPGQFFNVIFFSGDNVIPYSKTALIPANPDNKTKLYNFVDDVVPKEGTNPMPAIQKAFADKPELIYVLTDGFDQVNDFEAVYNEFKKLNPDAKVKVNCILLSSDPTKDKALVDILTRIAKDNGGLLKVISKDQF